MTKTFGTIIADLLVSPFTIAFYTYRTWSRYLFICNNHQCAVWCYCICYTMATNLEKLEYSRISLNMEKLAWKHLGILCNVRE